MNPPSSHPVETEALPGRSYRLRYLLAYGGLALFIVAAATLWVVVAAQIRITGMAADTRDTVLPGIVARQEVARDVERLILFGEELLNATDPGRRRQARLAAQTLVYNEAGFRSDEKIKEVGLRTLTTLTDLAAHRTQRDALNAEAFLLMMEIDEAFATRHPVGAAAWKELLIRVMSDESVASLDELANKLTAAARANGAQLSDKAQRLIALRRDIVEIDRSDARVWEKTTHELKSVTDTLATQARQLTSERFSEIQRLALQAEHVGLAGLGFVMLVVALFAFAAHRYFIRPLVQATANLEQALQGEDVRLVPSSRVAEIGSIVMAAGALVESTRTIEEERRKVLSARLEAVESASRMKSEFLSTMGHELRTPMNGVLGMAQLLRMSDLNDEQRDEVDTIIASGESLQNILTDILEFVAAEDGNIQVQPALCSLVELLNEAMDPHRVAAATLSIALRIDVAMDVPKQLNLDDRLLGKVLAILLKNAIAFTAQGEIAVTAQLEGPAQLHLSVRDTGAGMTPEVLERLFQPFYQADSSFTRSHGGLGLGLALAKRMVTAMGGSIAVRSTTGVGSVFDIALPVAAA